jgi:hypothetical protein
MTASPWAALGCFLSVYGKRGNGRSVCPIDRRHILQRHPGSIDGLDALCRFHNRRRQHCMAVTSVRLDSRRRNEEARDHEGQDRQRPPQKHPTLHVDYSTADMRLFRT